ncbi:MULTISPECIES: PGPGW domain-containing protein [Actinomadura]|uniref:TIGR02611 family protein n=1 Tax=Actinomadura litoris TaxID=2678616 RepID=A0A7K1L4U6_9ACTN|nr:MULTISPECIES: PGPGW domain-containing protein [Actinomadura]MBT2212441.1 TIGR02611 family protein [Actinomadura sp. NEAU-AAG7]MUN39419.1 TIGR02611 family protein [Actinomadura litoris]
MAINNEKDAEAGAFHRFRERVRRNTILNTAWRVGVFTVGATVLVGGLVMMVTPGPGIVAIVLGLAILATEFAWAQRALGRAKAAAERAKEKALDPRKKRRNTILAVLTGLLAGAAVIAYLVVYGFNLPWNVEDPTFWN